MRLVLSSMLLVLLSLPLACQRNTNSANKMNMKHNKDMQNLDSLLVSYTNRNMYYVDYGNIACLFEIRVNDVLVDKLSQPGNIGGTIATINPYILKSGKNKVSVRLWPNPGKKTIWYDVYPSFKPFYLSVKYEDLLRPNDNYVTVHQMPELRITPGFKPDEGGLPYFEYEGEFEAVVPYQIRGWSDCIDLRELPDIEQRVVQEFKRVRQLMIDRRFDELYQYRELKSNELCITLYESQERFHEKWANFKANIEKGAPEEFQAIEDYELVFQADGRMVTLYSLKKEGFPSALLWIKEKEGESLWNAHFFYLNLGIRKGTDEFIPVL